MGFNKPMAERYDDAEPFPPVPPELDEYICDYVDGTMDPAVRGSFEEYLAANPQVADHIETLVSASDMLRNCADQCPCVAEDFQTRLRCAVEHECAPDDTAGAWLDRMSGIVLVTSAVTIMCLAVLAPSPSSVVAERAEPGSTVVLTPGSSRSALLSGMSYNPNRPPMVRLGPSTPVTAFTAGAQSYPTYQDRSRDAAYLATSYSQ
jgi:anti-sigma factor RsiW